MISVVSPGEQYGKNSAIPMSHIAKGVVVAVVVVVVVILILFFKCRNLGNVRILFLSY